MVEKLAKDVSDSKSNIHRLIKLTELIKNLQNKVNLGEQLTMKAGVELSYLDSNEQNIVNNYLDEKKVKISVAQAENIKAVKGTVTNDVLEEILNPSKKENKQKFTGKMDKEIYKKYKDKFKSDNEFNSLIDELLAKYFGIYA